MNIITNTDAYSGSNAGVQPSDSILDNARRYVAGGLSIIPIKTDGSKHAKYSWKEFQSRPPSELEVHKWFRSETGLAIVAGKVSGNLEVLDFDAPELFEPWADLVNRLSETLLGRLPIVKTPSGGRHVYYRCENIEGSKKLAVRQIESAIKTLIETRGEASYVIAPFSPPSCHPDKKSYELLQGDLADIPVITAQQREILLDAARSFNEKTNEDWKKVGQHDEVEYSALQDYSMKLKPTGTFYNSPSSLLVRVSNKRKCEICRKPDWCSYTEDEGLALCMREPSGSLKQANNGAYIHITRPQFRNFRSTLPCVSYTDGRNPLTGEHKVSATSIDSYNADVDGSTDIIKLASFQHTHKVYSYLLEDCLKLTPEHTNHLLNERCLSDSTIASNLYASMPSELEYLTVCMSMQEQFGDGLHGVPGFYSDKPGCWMMRQLKGLMIPVRDYDARITALLVRLDSNYSAKYIWFSTPPDKWKNGTSSGAPLHFARPNLAKASGLAIVTEGALKADVVAEIWNCGVIGIAGVSNFDADSFGYDIQLKLPSVKKLAIAFDSDWRQNKAVRGGLERLIHALKATTLTITILNWDAEYGKGFDDFLIGAQKIAA